MIQKKKGLKPFAGGDGLKDENKFCHEKTIF